MMKLFDIIHVGDIKVYDLNEFQTYSKSVLQEVEIFWNLEIKNKPHLFNRKAFCFKNLTIEKNTAIISGNFIDYKIIIADRKLKSLNLFQVGVSGICITNESEPRILFSKRGKSTTEYSDFWELAPSGNLDTSVLGDDSTISYKDQLISEFLEETNLSSDVISKITPFCLIRDNHNHVYDICCKIELDLHSKIHFSNSEYISSILVSYSDLPNFIQKNSQNIVPTSLGILECIMQHL